MQILYKTKYLTTFNFIWLQTTKFYKTKKNLNIYYKKNSYFNVYAFVLEF